MKTPHYSLTLYISGLFMLFAAIIGTVLIAISYQHANQLMAEVAKKTSYENSQKVETIFKREIAPILTVLDWMATDQFITPEQAVTDRRWLSFNQLMFSKNPNLVALYIADTHGSFTLLRPMQSQTMRQQFNAPNDAALLINHTETNGLNQHYFLNDQLISFEAQERHDNQYDPRVRPWYATAEIDGHIRATHPYPFYFMKTNGVTLSRTLTNHQGVVGADFTLSSLSQLISSLGDESHSQLVLFDQRFNVLAQHNSPVDLSRNQEVIAQQLEPSLFSSIMNRVSSQVIYETAHDNNGQEWSVTLTPVQLDNNLTLLLAQATPKMELIAGLLSMRDKQVSVAIGLLIFSFTGVFLMTKRLTAPFNLLITSTNRIGKFDFKKSTYPRSHIKEVAQLTQSLQFMEHTLFDLLQLLRATANNQDFSLLAHTIAKQSYLITRAETIALFMRNQTTNQLELAINQSIIPFKIVLSDLLNDTPWLRSQLRKGETVHLTKDDNIIKKYQEQFFNSDLYIFPLLNPQKELIGVLNIGYERAINDEQKDKHSFVSELLRFAELAKQNIDNSERQQQLFDRFLEGIIKAIDVKESNPHDYYQQSPYLAMKLLDSAIADTTYFPYLKNWTNNSDLNLVTGLLYCGRISTQPQSTNEQALGDLNPIQLSLQIASTQTLLAQLPQTEALLRATMIIERIQHTVNHEIDYMGVDHNELSIKADALWITNTFVELMRNHAADDPSQALTRALDQMTNMAITNQLSPRLYLLFLRHDLDHTYLHQFSVASDKYSGNNHHHIDRVKQYLRTLI
jgi:hypothetical protein